MKKIVTIAALVILASAAAWVIFNRYRVVVPPVDIRKSEVGWSAKSVSDTHYGKVQLSKAKLEFQNDVLVGGEFVVDMSSITVDDVKDPEHNRDFIQHITTEDFFETNRFPTASFAITDVAPAADNRYRVHGNMTIKGVTKPVQFDATVTRTSDSNVASAIIELNRTEFGIDYGSQGKRGSEKDWFIYDTFTLNVNIVSAR